MISWDNPWGAAPTLGSKLRTIPAYLLWLFTGFISGWVQSRRTRTLLLGAPALVIGFLVFTSGAKTRDGLPSETIRRYLESAEACVKRNQTDEAEFYIKRLKTLGQPNDAILAIEAAVASQRNRPDLAEQAYQQMLTNSDKSRDSAAHRLLAILQLNTTKSVLSSRAEEAIGHLESAIKDNDADITSHELLARVYLERGDLENCSVHLEQVVAVNPAVAIDLARLFDRMNRGSRKIEYAAKAAEYFSKVLAPDAMPPINQPDARVQAYLNWTDAILMLGQFDKGVKVLIEELDRNPSPELRKRLAVLYLAQEGEIPRGEGWAKRAELVNLSRTFDPDSATGLIALANIAAHGPPELAKPAARDLQPYLDKNSATAPVYYLMGTAESQKGNLERAIQLLRKAVELQPESDVTWNNLAQTLVMCSPPNWEEAENCINEAIRLNPAPAPYHDTCGQIMVGLERWPEAIRELEVAMQSMPAEASIHKGLATAYEQLGDDDLAEYHKTRARALKK